MINRLLNMKDGGVITLKGRDFCFKPGRLANEFLNFVM